MTCPHPQATLLEVNNSSQSSNYLSVGAGQYIYIWQVENYVAWAGSSAWSFSIGGQQVLGFAAAFGHTQEFLPWIAPCLGGTSHTTRYLDGAPYDTWGPPPYGPFQLYFGSYYGYRGPLSAGNYYLTCSFAYVNYIGRICATVSSLTPAQMEDCEPPELPPPLVTPLYPVVKGSGMAVDDIGEG